MNLKNLFPLLGLLALLGCQAEPSAYKVPVPDKVFVDKSGSLSTYNPEVDILFIIDDSGSMGSYQQRLAQNAGLFISEFFNAKFIDYHIGVTTSSESGSGSKAPGGRLHRVGRQSFVSRKTFIAESILSQMLNVGSGGNNTEKFLNVPHLTFSDSMMNSFNNGFYRENAHLVIFILTDVYDQSDVDPQETYDFLLNLKKGESSKLHYAGAIVTIEKEECTAESSTVLPVNLRRFATLFQGRGHLFNICQSNYGKDLARVAASIVDAVSTVYLENLPDPRTMQVFYGDQLIPNAETGGWTYDYSINAIHLSPEIDIQGDAGSKLSIRYEEYYSPEPVTK